MPPVSCLRYSLVFCLASGIGPCSAGPRFDFSLHGSGWELAGCEWGEGERLGIHGRRPQEVKFLPVSVPNNVQLTVLKDPYGQAPEVAAVNRREWWYVRSFRSPGLTAGQQARLVFDGVDYFAAVWLNGRKLGEHEGAYTRFAFDVSNLLRAGGDNYLAVRVTSPLKVAGRTHYEFMKGEFAEPWDALPGPGGRVYPVGLHRGVRLEVSSGTRIEEVRVWTAALREGQADLKVRVSLSSLEPRRTSLEVAIRPKGRSGPAVILPPRAFSLAGAAGRNEEAELPVRIPDPRLWWTWDQGPQNLYTARATLRGEDGSTLDESTVTFGIRTIERDENLLYRLNGRPVFVRGAWYSMSRMYPADTDGWTYEKDLRLLRHANANHLVNYTVVEKPEFYALADELGILLFVELPFNQQGPMDALDGRYPRREEYIRWAAAESGRIIRMLSNHPSIAVWSAISETTKSGTDFAAYPDPRIAGSADGYQAFVQAIGKAVQENDPDALHHASYCDFGEKHFWYGGLSQSTTYDQHFDSGHWFVSEYGAMAFYSFESLTRTVNPGEIWRGSGRTWSNLRLPVDLKTLSYLSGYQYSGAALVARNVGDFVDRRPASLQEYVHESQLYQAFLYNYAGDVYRRRLFRPVNGIRSWHFKDFPEKPISGFGVIDCFHVPKMAYYAARRTWAPLSISYAVQFPTESLTPGAPFRAPVWISNASNEPVKLAVTSTLFDLNGARLRRSAVEATLEARQARMVEEIEWAAPAAPGIYILRGEASPERGEPATAEMYLKVVPPVVARPLRVLVAGTSDWTAPVCAYLRNLGASVTEAARPPAVSLFHPADRFPQSATELRANFDVIWLAGFNRYWSEAPARWTETMVQSVELGVSLIHSGSWASFHGGGASCAALDLTPLAAILPVEVLPENDVWTDLPADQSRPITVLPAAPAWLRAVDFGGLHIERYHMLQPRAGVSVLLEVDGHPLLVAGRHGAGRTVAYLGFSPERRTNPESSRPLLVDREIRARENRLFFIASAAALALASGGEPASPVADLIEARVKPVYEGLKPAHEISWPEFSMSWASRNLARIRIRNGGTYLTGLRLRFDGPDIREGNALQLWSNQFFDLLPGEQRECTAEVIRRDGAPVGEISLVAEVMGGRATRQYPAPLMTK